MIIEQGQDPSAWDSFIKSNNMDPNLVLWETHPYPVRVFFSLADRNRC